MTCLPGAVNLANYRFLTILAYQRWRPAEFYGPFRKPKGEPPMLPRFILMFALVTIVSGCVKPPLTAEGFRQLAASGGRWVDVEKFEVDRPYREVARTFERLSEACLRVQVVTTSSGGYRSHPTTFRQTYKPTVKVNKRRAEFYIQMGIEGTNLIKVSKEAEGGYFLMVVDAYPVGRNRTRIEFFRPNMGHDVLTKTVRNWATGKSTACPDLTK